MQSEAPKKRSRRGAKLFFFLLIILLLGGLLMTRGKSVVLNIFKSAPTPTPTVEPTKEPTPTEMPTDTPEPTGKTGSTPTKKPTPQVSVDPVDKTTKLDRSKLSVEIQNGSGQAGVAGKAADTLKNLGYSVGSTGNADNYDYQGVTISVKSSKSSYLPLLKSDLSSSYTVGSTSATLSNSSSSDAVVIVGK
jgi:outer membrane biosynthesis protein TonB